MKDGEIDVSQIEWNAVSSSTPLVIFVPCQSVAPILRIGDNSVTPMIAVGCQKEYGHDGPHEWKLVWE